MRRAGALLPVSSLPAADGIGDFGPEAYKFIDILATMKLKIWQVLPLNPLGFGNSPYQAYSSVAGEELYISIDFLVRDGLLNQQQRISFHHLAAQVNYQLVRQQKQSMLKLAFANFRQQPEWREAYQQFCANSPWLNQYAVFRTFKQINGQQPWTKWPAAFKSWIQLPELDLIPYDEDIAYVKFLQFMFFRQWSELKVYANQHEIQIMGDMPIYSGLDSLDVWENQQLFVLDAEQSPTFVAGVPPDFFSSSGQRWGNPVYNWAKLAATGFKFWIERLRGNAQLFDIIRIDHFRGFDTYWRIPVSSLTAAQGEWVAAPGYALFDAIYRELPDIKLVVEDLGDLRAEVFELRDHYHLKGMQIFQFIFDPAGANTALENEIHTIIYTGTHDNSTLNGWYLALAGQRQRQIQEYFGSGDLVSLRLKILNYLLNCAAEEVIFPIQDVLGLDDQARFNTPGQIGSPNWEWKLIDFTQLNAAIDFMLQAVTAAAR